MSKKINFKNILLIGLPIIVLLLVILILINLLKENKPSDIKVNTDGIRFKEEYEKLNNITNEEGKKYPTINISSNNIIKYSYEQEIINIFNNKVDAVVYFGYPSCLYCRASAEVLLNTASATNLDVIYYIDTERTDISDELINLLGEELTEEEKIYASSVIFINDGEIVSYNKDTLSSHKDPYQKLNESQIEGLSEIFKYGINDVIESKNIKK